MPKRPTSPIGLRSEFILYRIKYLGKELAKLSKEMERNEMGPASNNVKLAAECLISAEKTWNPLIKW